MAKNYHKDTTPNAYSTTNEYGSELLKKYFENQLNVHDDIAPYKKE